MPGRTRLVGHDDDGGRRTGGCVAGRAAAPLPHQGRAGRGGRRALGAESVQHAQGARGDGRRRQHARRRRADRRLLRERPVHRRAGAVGRRAHRLRSCKMVVVPLEARLGRETHRLALELLGADESKPGVSEAVQATLDLVRGLALANQLTDDSKRRAPSSGTGRGCWRPHCDHGHCWPTCARRARSSTIWLHRWMTGQSPRPREGWTIAHQIAIWRGPTASRCSRSPIRRRSSRQTGRGTATLVDRTAAEGARDLGKRCWTAGARRASSWLERAGRGAAREKMAWFGPPMSPGVDGDRAADGDLGARPGRGGRAWRAARLRPSGSGTWRTSACARSGSRSLLQRAAGPGSAVPGRADWAGWRPVDVGSGGRREPGHRASTGLLPAGHAAAQPQRPGAARDRSGRRASGCRSRRRSRACLEAGR